MRLLRLELEGFKSFAERTAIEFGPGITCIVGPNGCGKSNIVDAIRWVLGELNPRTLRGKSMSDVIFHGNKHRRPASAAHVQLTFLDDTLRLGLACHEVRIARRLHRSGESEYLLNGEPCRLKDIRRLFMDTGVGVDTYSVMEQGKVDKLLQAGPRDRRYLFEEAAGISKFKSQRSEAMRRLENVEQNLARLGDIITEVDGRLRQVKKQADRALTYRRYEDELQHLGLTLARARDLDYAQQLDRLLEEQAELEHAQRNLTGQREQLETRHGALSEQVERTREALEQARRQLVRHREQKAACEDQIELCRRRQSELELDEKQHAAQQIRLNGRIVQIEAELERLADDAASLSRAREVQVRATEQLLEEETKLRADAHGLEDELERYKREGMAALESRARATNELASIEAEQRALEGREQRIRERRRELARRIAATAAERDRLASELTVNQGRLDQLRTSLEQQQHELSATREQQEQLAQRIAEARDRRARAMSRLELLEQLEARREGLGAAARWLLEQAANGSLSGIRGLVADLLSVKPEHAIATAAALGSLAEAIVVADHVAIEAAGAALRAAGKGGVCLIPLDRPAQQVAAGELLASVTVPGLATHEARALLANLVCGWRIAPDLSSALLTSERCVTLAGDRVDQGRVTIAGQDTGGLIARKSEVAVRRSELAELEALLASLESTRDGVGQRLRELQRDSEQLAGTLHQHELGSVALQREHGELTRQLETLREEDQLLDEESSDLASDAVAFVDRTEQLHDAIARFDATKRTADAGLERLALSRSEHAQRSDQLNRRLSAARVQLAQTEEKEIAARHQLEAAQRDLAERRHELITAQNQEQQCQSRRSDNTQLIAELQETQHQSTEAIATLEQQREVRATELATVTAALREAGEQLTLAGRDQETLRERMGALALQRRELEVARDNLHQRTIEDLGIDLTLQQPESAPLFPVHFAITANEDDAEDHAEAADRDDAQSAPALAVGETPPAVSTALDSPANSETTPAALPTPLSARELKQLENAVLRLKRKIKKLGPINLEAIGELDEHQARSHELHAQRDELVAARDDLLEIVQRFDTACKERFVASFTLIRDNFRALFRKLFGGGKADLVLEDPADLLETGIEIIARPPGKEPRTISLLSGGERAMTAIALLFSVYQTRPSPFCLLDEIDAPLDQANIDRFTQLVREFLSESQFVVITHSKQTMTVADTLFGVTSGSEPGISRIVSVRLDTVERISAATA
jgi:chromosome segregation protein